MLQIEKEKKIKGNLLIGRCPLEKFTQMYIYYYGLHKVCVFDVVIHLHYQNFYYLLYLTTEYSLAYTQKKSFLMLSIY